MHPLPAKKSLGQHFLNNTHVPQTMVGAVTLLPEDTILEIGPGTGVLTTELLKTGKRVVAVETDRRAYDLLVDTFKDSMASGSLTLFHYDIRTVSAQTLELDTKPYVLIANIPYFITGALLRQFLTDPHPPRALVFLVQREVAERIAREKKESLLSLSVKLYGNPKYVKTVGRGCFTPPPRVDSAIISITDISTERLQGLKGEFVFDMLHIAFGSRRKQCIGNLTAEYPRTFLEDTFSSLALSHTIRAEDIPLEKWIPLCKKLFAYTLDSTH